MAFNLTTRTWIAIDILCQVGEDYVTPYKELVFNTPYGYPHYRETFVRLKRAKLLKGHRGNVGGYSLGRSLFDITVSDVMKAVELQCVYNTTDPGEELAQRFENVFSSFALEYLK